jgi:hypothetical protein
MTADEIADLQADAVTLDERSHLTNLEKKLLRALEVTQQRQQWRPMATAPRDGTRFMFASQSGVVGTGGFLHGRWFAADSALGGKDVEPVHWMPLPAPPRPPTR